MITEPTRQTLAFTQRHLNLASGYNLKVDGLWGTKSKNAWHDYAKSRGQSTTIHYSTAVAHFCPGMELDSRGDLNWGSYYTKLYGDDIVSGHPVPVAGVRGDFVPAGVIVHHTAGPKNRDQVPWERMAKGHSRLRGPLCNFATSRNGTIQHITNGRAHHAGPGDDDVLEGVQVDMWDLSVKPDIDGITGNSYFYGIEVDWAKGDSTNIPALQHAATLRLAAMYCYAWKWSPLRRVLGHKEWTHRKTDPAFDMGKFRAETVYMYGALAEDAGADSDVKEVVDFQTNGFTPKAVALDLECPHCGNELVLDCKPTYEFNLKKE